MGWSKVKRGRNYFPKQNDIIAKLTFGTWVNLIKDQNDGNNILRQLLWEEALHRAFPYGWIDGESLEQTRHRVADQLSGVLGVRNRVAHHDNLLKVIYHRRINQMYGLIGRIGSTDLEDYVPLYQLKRFVKEDPRIHWESALDQPPS